MLRFEIIRLLKGSAIYGIALTFQKFVGILMLPFFTAVLTPEDYGVIALVSLVSIAFTGLYNLGTGNSMGILFFKEEREDRQYQIIWSTFYLILINSLVLTFVLLIFSKTLSTIIFEDNKYYEYFNLVFVGLVFSTISLPFLNLLRMKEKAIKYSLIMFISTMITLIANVLLVLVFEYGVFGFFLGNLIGQMFLFLIVLFFISKNVQHSFEISYFKPLVNIGYPSIFGLFAFLLIDYADRQMIQRILGLEQLGIYTISYSLGMVIMVAVGAFQSAWSPFFMSFINRKEDAKIIFGKVLRYYILFFGFLVLCFFAFSKTIMYLMADSSFHEGYILIGFISMAYFFNGIYMIMLPGLYFCEKLYIQSFLEWSTAIINIILNLILISKYEVIGAAYATVLSYFYLCFVSWYIGKRYLDIDYEWNKIIRIVILYGIIGYALFLISTRFSNYIVVLVSLIVLFVLIGIVIKFFIDENERKLLLSKLRRNNFE